MDDPPSELPELRDGERVFTVPQSWSIGRCLNMAIAAAHGRFWAKMDDDDDYSAFYLEELADYYHATQADAVGRQAVCFYFAGEDVTLVRYFSRDRCMRTISDGTFVAGATLSAACRDSIPAFSNVIRNAADADWVRSVHASPSRLVSYDSTSMVVHRSADESIHTWRMGPDLSNLGRFETICGGNLHKHIETHEL